MSKSSSNIRETVREDIPLFISVAVILKIQFFFSFFLFPPFRMSYCSVSSSDLMEGCCPGGSLVSVQRNIAKLLPVCRWPTEQVSVMHLK